MIIALSIKFIYTLKIHKKQNINILLKKVKIMILKISKIQRLLLNVQIIYKLFIKKLKSTTEADNVMY